VQELRTILHYPDPRLRQRSLPVLTFDDAILALSGDLVRTLHQTGGIGLSAPQVGVLLRVMVMDLSPDGSTPEVYVNPELVRRSAF
jgi:peptide deformylase